MTPFRNCILCMELSAVMIDRAFSHHSTDRSLYKHLLLCIRVPDTVHILLLLSKVTQKHFRQPFRPSKGAIAPYGVLFARFILLDINLRANFIFMCISVYHTFLNTQKPLFFKGIYTYTLISELRSSRIFKVCPYVFLQIFLEILWHFFHYLLKY